MSDDFCTEEGLKIHYFLINNGFNYIKKDIDGDDFFVISFSKYTKGYFTVKFDELFSKFEVKENDRIVFEVKKDSESKELNKGFTVEVKKEITLDDVIGFFRDEKIKGLLNNE